MALLQDHSYLTLSIGSILAYLLWTAIYNIFFHPLASIPGPWLPALTSWYEVYFDCVSKGGGQYPFHIRKLHEKYGPIIRPVPDQVHISDPEYLDTIYATRGRNQPTSKGLNVDQSLAGAEDHHLHRMRREAMNPYFSQKAILELQGLFTKKRDKVVAILDDAIQTQDQLNLSDVYFAYANDIVRAFSFGSDSDLLNNLEEAKNQRNNLARLLRGIHFQRHFTVFFRLMGRIMPVLFGAESALPPAVMDLVRFKQKIGKVVEAVLADENNNHKEQRSVFYELRDSPSLPAEEKTTARLQDEATLLVMAGTESTCKSLGIATFYLLWLPEVMNKLREEFARARQQQGTREISLSILLTLPYLVGVILEANRLSFGVTGRCSRYSPDETLLYTAPYGPYKGTAYTLPPGTQMSTVTYCTHTNESLFPYPSRFDPERWIGNSEDVNRRKRYMHALGKGHRRCLGINVANAAMSLVLAELADYDMDLFQTEESDIKYQFDFQISHPRSDSEGVRAVVRGRRGS